MALSLRASAALGMTELAADTLVSFIQQIVREQVQQTMGGLLGAVGARRRRLRMGADGGASGGDPDGRRGRRLESGVGQVVHPKLSSLPRRPSGSAEGRGGHRS